MNTTVKFTFPNGKVEEFTVDDEVQKSLDSGSRLGVVLKERPPCDCPECTFTSETDGVTH